MVATGSYQVSEFMKHQRPFCKAFRGQKAKPASEWTGPVRVSLGTEARTITASDTTANKDTVAFGALAFPWPFAFG